MFSNRSFTFCLAFLGFTLVSQSQTQSISLSQIWNEGTFRSESVTGVKSMNDGVHYTSLFSSKDKQAVVKYAYKSGKATDTLFTSSDLTYQGSIIRFSTYSFNTDETKVLLAQDMESIYRRSSKANYFAFDLNTGELKPITDFSLGKQQLAEFSPTENKVAFVRDNNIFISDLDLKEEKQITSDGKWGYIINGAVDWVYEEEFSFHKGFYWSPDGNNIAYYKFDESEVQEFDLTYYYDLYPTLYNYKYPKAGEKNSRVEVHIYNLDDARHIEVDVNADEDQYIPRMKWTNSADELCIMRMNRLQNRLEFLLAAVKDGKDIIQPRIIYTEISDTYLDINDNLIFLEDGSHYLWNSERDGWNHIYMCNMDGSEIIQLTKGQWEVVSFYGINQKRSELYFSAAIDNSITESIYSLKYGPALKGKKSNSEDDNREELRSLTPNGKSNSAIFSKTHDYFINYASNASTPAEITLHSHDGKLIRTIQANEKLKETVSRFAISKKEFGTIANSNGDELNYWMIKPPNFNAEQSYPLMFMIYGGPGSNTVSDEWGGSTYFWHQMLAQQGYVIVSVDPRGTMRKGRDFKHSTYLQLGKNETEDFIDAAKHFGSLDYIDADRIGIMGWSYGGYMSSLCMTKGADYFKLGIAVAPVTNWRYYDSIYTERFMRTPQENAEGYDSNSPINHVEKLKGKYLLVHGSADDNVHYQNTMEMIKALVDADKQFDLFIYPNKNHGIYGGNTRHHLYTKMTEFIISGL